MKKIHLALAAIACLLLISGCGAAGSAEQKTAVKALAAETTLPEDGIITKEQMDTIVDKDKTYHFKGQADDKISYQWIYDGKQVQNPVEQHLKLTIKEQGLDQIKKAANNAAEALELKIPAMELAGSPQIQLTIPKKWAADQVFLTKKSKDKLQKVKNIPVRLSVKDQQTTLAFNAIEAGVTYYLVGGITSPAAKAQLGDEGSNGTTTNSSRQDNAVTDKGTTASGAASEANAENTENGGGESGGTTGANNGDPQGNAQGNSSGSTLAGNEGGTQQESGSSVTVSINCGTILNNWGDLKESKRSFVPSDGWILGATSVPIKNGDTVYDVLVRVTKAQGIQMEASYTPMYGAYYIEGINQLYEFDCGNLSGWMYRVNGWYPNYGASKYQVKAGDNIEWLYTCDLGRDIGGGQAAGNGK